MSAVYHIIFPIFLFLFLFSWYTVVLLYYFPCSITFRYQTVNFIGLSLISIQYPSCLSKEIVAQTLYIESV